ncbi:MAG: peptidoglycan-binding domain-containing protein [Hyphomicrobium sp.]
MKLRVLLLTSALVAAATAPGHLKAADSNGHFALRGVALATCEQFLQASKERQESVLLAGGWLEGYMTAINQLMPKTFDIAPWQNTDTVLALVKHNCERNRDQRFFAVVTAMIEFLAENRLQEQSDRMMAEAEGQRVAVYAEVMRDVQQRLIDKGLLQGNADGQFGSKTQAALQEFQKKENIQVTGLPDQVTLWRLLSDEKAPQSGEAAPAAPAPSGGPPPQ